MPFRIRNAGGADLEAIRGALSAAGLPVDGIDAHIGSFYVCEDRGVVQGTAGLEVHGKYGLLRSVVVSPAVRRLGAGRRLCERVLDHAGELECRAVYLLTMDAAAYFEKLGFEALSRDEAPEEIRASEMFSALCPASAVLMRRGMES